ncbi:cell wall-binding repeat-containing protein [Pontibacillus salicampi]|uniref:Cell wall-binding repeat-containing protein n=1 Tax=Pontibacillus salicampi TaxID=1449801 RepID=A0ABV6LSA6_9BACI
MRKSIVFILFVSVFGMLFFPNPAQAGSKNTIIIDPGHGGRYTGTAGYSGNSTGYAEKHANLEVSLKLRDKLERRGYTVHMTRTSNSKDFGYPLHTDLGNRSDLANELAEGNNNHTILLSVHHNASGWSPSTRGYETYYFDIENGIDQNYPPDPLQIEYSPESRRLAHTIHNQIINNVPISEGPNGIKANDLFVTRNAHMPAALLELGYMSNPDEERLIKTDKYQNKASEEIANAVDQYFDVYEVYDHEDNRLKIYESKNKALDYAKSKSNVYVLDKSKQKQIYNSIAKDFGVYHTSQEDINKLFVSKEDAINYAEDWKHTRVVNNKTGDILWSNYMSKDFVVQQRSNGTISRHYQEDQAIEYAKDHKDTQVVNLTNGKVVWNNYLRTKYKVTHAEKGVLKEFYHKGPAIDYADTWAGTTVVNMRNNATVWENDKKAGSFTFQTEEISSNNRVRTAVEVSKKLYPNGFSSGHSAKTVILATAHAYADALSAAPLAAQEGNAPILLTNPNSMEQEVEQEIHRLNTKRVVILGGPNAVSASIEDKLEKKGLSVDRIAGNNRVQTNQKINDRLDDVDGAMVASSSSFPDALGAAPIAAMKDWAIVLTDKTMDPASKEYVNFKDVAIVGGDGVVSNSVENALIDQNGKDRVIRLAGDQRYETQNEILTYFEEDISSAHTLTATGENFPDGLTASSLAVKYHAPLVLVGKEVDRSMDGFLQQYGNENAIESLKVVGGVLKDNVVHNISNYLD